MQERAAVERTPALLRVWFYSHPWPLSLSPWCCLLVSLFICLPSFSYVLVKTQAVGFCRINISFPPPQLGVICVTGYNVHCHLHADCCTVPNRSVHTGRRLMSGARQSQAHFSALFPHRRPLVLFVLIPDHLLFPDRDDVLVWLSNWNHADDCKLHLEICSLIPKTEGLLNYLIGDMSSVWCLCEHRTQLIQP